jgi:hypothetical protein
LLTLEDPAAYRLEVKLDQSRVAFVSPGTDAKVRLDPGDTWVTGRVVEIARVDPASHSFLVKIDLPPGFAVRSGQFGRASLSGPPRRGTVIPTSALMRRGQLTFVFVADSDQRVHLRAVSIGETAGDRTEVFAGLREGDRVVTSPTSTLQDGDAVAGVRP